MQADEEMKLDQAEQQVKVDNTMDIPKTAPDHLNLFQSEQRGVEKQTDATAAWTSAEKTKVNSEVEMASETVLIQKQPKKQGK